MPPCSEEFLEANPYRLIPVMVHGEVTLYESQAICQYLAELLGGPMGPQNGAERARINMYGLSSISNCECAVVCVLSAKPDISCAVEPNFLPMVFSGVSDKYMEALEPLLGGLNKELEGRQYLVGEGEGRFTVADVMLASVVGEHDRLPTAFLSTFSHRWHQVNTAAP